MFTRLALAAVSMTAVHAPALAQCSVTRFDAPDYNPHGRFGLAVDLEGGTALIGGEFELWGTARLFDSETGAQLAELDPPFGTFRPNSVALNGALAVVGSPTPGGAAVYVFDVPAGTFRSRLTATGAKNGDRFGWDVAADAGRVVAGAPLTDGAGMDSGAAYVFDLATPQSPMKLLPSAPNPAGQFGMVVAVAEGRVVVGAPGESPAGAVYVFDAVSGAELRRITPAFPDLSLGFGQTLSLRGDQALIGCALAARGILVDLNTGAELVTYVPPHGGIASTALTAEKAILSNGFFEEIWVFDRSSGQLEATLRSATEAWAGFGRELDAEGRRLLVGGAYASWSENGGEAYRIDLCADVGASYCGPAVPNSTLRPAKIRAAGLTTPADDYFFLLAEGLPANRLGYFLASTAQAFVVGPGESAGNLCLGGPLVRFREAGHKSSHAGTLELRVDLADLGVLAGETWNYQAWYRDGNELGKKDSNFTDGVSVLYR